MYERLFEKNKKSLDFIKEREEITDEELNSIFPISATTLRSKTIVGVADLMTEFAKSKALSYRELLIKFSKFYDNHHIEGNLENTVDSFLRSELD